MGFARASESVIPMRTRHRMFPPRDGAPAHVPVPVREGVGPGVPRKSRGGVGESYSPAKAKRSERHSHSMVPGGLLVTSNTTRLTPGTSLTMRFEIRASTSYGRRAQSAVIASSDVTTSTATTLAYVR